MDLKEEIIRSTETIVNKLLLEYSRKNTEIATVVTGVSANKYRVSIDHIDYWVNDGINLRPAVGTAVWVRTPNGDGNMNEAYICARR